MIPGNQDVSIDKYLALLTCACLKLVDNVKIIIYFDTKVNIHLMVNW